MKTRIILLFAASALFGCGNNASRPEGAPLDVVVDSYAFVVGSVLKNYHRDPYLLHFDSETIPQEQDRAEILRRLRLRGFSVIGDTLGEQEHIRHVVVGGYPGKITHDVIIMYFGYNLGGPTGSASYTLRFELHEGKWKLVDSKLASAS